MYKRQSEAEFAGAPKGTVPAFIPTSYMDEARLRIMAYRSLAELRNLPELEILASGWRDRFGRPPEAVENLLTCTKLKLMASKSRIDDIEIRNRQLRLTRNGHPIQVDGRYPRLKARKDRDTLAEAVELVATL